MEFKYEIQIENLEQLCDYEIPLWDIKLVRYLERAYKILLHRKTCYENYYLPEQERKNQFLLLTQLYEKHNYFLMITYEKYRHIFDYGKIKNKSTSLLIFNCLIENIICQMTLYPHFFKFDKSSSDFISLSKDPLSVFYEENIMNYSQEMVRTSWDQLMVELKNSTFLDIKELSNNNTSFNEVVKDFYEYINILFVRSCIIFDLSVEIDQQNIEKNDNGISKLDITDTFIFDSDERYLKIGEDKNVNINNKNMMQKKIYICCNDIYKQEIMNYYIIIHSLLYILDEEIMDKIIAFEDKDIYCSYLLRQALIDMNIFKENTYNNDEEMLEIYELFNVYFNKYIRSVQSGLTESEFNEVLVRHIKKKILPFGYEHTFFLLNNLTNHSKIEELEVFFYPLNKQNLLSVDFKKRPIDFFTNYGLHKSEKYIPMMADICLFQQILQNHIKGGELKWYENNVFLDKDLLNYFIPTRSMDDKDSNTKNYPINDLYSHNFTYKETFPCEEFMNDDRRWTKPIVKRKKLPAILVIFNNILVYSPEDNKMILVNTMTEAFFCYLLFIITRLKSKYVPYNAYKIDFSMIINDILDEMLKLMNDDRNLIHKDLINFYNKNDILNYRNIGENTDLFKNMSINRNNKKKHMTFIND